MVIDLNGIDPALLIASTAAANGLPLYTRNPSDFVALGRLITITAL